MSESARTVKTDRTCSYCGKLESVHPCSKHFKGSEDVHQFRVATQFERAGADLGKLVTEKNLAYGDAVAKCGDVFKILYPNGIKPEQYRDVTLLGRILDKMFRIANSKKAFGESPYRDIAGYGLLGLVLDEEEDESERTSKPVDQSKEKSS